MSTVVELVGAAASGSLGTLGIKTLIDRRVERRVARKAIYVELVRVLSSRRDAVRRISFNTDAPPPADLPQERLDTLNALLLIDASPEIRALSDACLRAENKFWASHSTGAPIDTDEFGIFHYRFDLVRDRDEEGRNVIMRMALGKIADDFSAKVELLVERVRRELHGRSAG